MVELGLFLPKNTSGISGPPLTLESTLADRACAPTTEIFTLIYILFIINACSSTHEVIGQGRTRQETTKHKHEHFPGFREAHSPPDVRCSSSRTL